ERAEHQRFIDTRPRDILPIELADARSHADHTRRQLAQAERRVTLREDELDHLNPLGRLTRHGRQIADQAAHDLVSAHRAATEAVAELTRAQAAADQTSAAHAAALAWGREHAWRVGRVNEIDQQLAVH